VTLQRTLLAGSIRQDGTGRGVDAAIIFAEPCIEAAAASRAAARRGVGGIELTGRRLRVGLPGSYVFRPKGRTALENSTLPP
jgi:hypothetical protein